MERASGAIGAAKRPWITPAMYGTVLLLAAVFFFSFFNRFAGLRSGDGEFEGGAALLAGKLPYRDYFTAGPPLNILKSALLLKVFGTELIVSRTAGVMERLVIAAVLLAWLRRIFAPMPALLASAVTIIVSAGDRTDPIASYNHDAILWGMLSGFAASYALDQSISRQKLALLAAASGLCAALSLLTKQTVGLGVTAAVLVLVAAMLVRVATAARARLWITMFSVGFVLPVGATGLLLGRMSLLRSCLRMLFVTGPSAKAGHGSDFLRRALVIGWDNAGWVVLALFALGLSWGALHRFARGAPAEASRFQRSAWLAGALLAGLGAIGAAAALSFAGFPALHDISKSSVYYVCFGLLVLLGRLGWQLIASPSFSPGSAQSLLFCGVGGSVALMLALSWPAFEAMTLPGLGFLLAAVLSSARPRSLPWVCAILCGMVLMQTWEKLDLPFGFDLQEEPPVRLANQVSHQPRLRGLRLPATTTAFLDGTASLVREHSTAGETIFTYPEIGLLYSLTDRNPPTFAGSHNMDVVNDAMAIEEAERLRASPPAVIVYTPETEQQMRSAEDLWRRGRPSGQRAIVRAIEDLTRGYKLAGRWRLTPNDPEILVFVRH